jgi:tetratricopeptide (TPR) repeat protein
VPRAAIAVVALLVVAAATRTWARNRDWKDNTVLFTRTVETSPRSCKAANGLASELLASGRLDEARRFAERALAIYPRYAEARANLAKIDRAAAQAAHDNAAKAALRTQAEEHARAALAVDPANADSWNTLAALALDRGDVDAAEAGYREALARDASYGPAINGLGVALSQRAEREPDPGRRAELQTAAAAQFDRALALDPADPQAAQNAATLRALAAGEIPAGAGAGAGARGAEGERLMAQGRLEEALAAYREAARLEPSTARAFLGIGGALAALAERAASPAERQELLDGAIAAFTHALTLEPGNPAAHMNLGVALIRSRREPAQVAEHFRAYLRLVPQAENRAQMEQTIRDMDALAARER